MRRGSRAGIVGWMCASAFIACAALPARGQITTSTALPVHEGETIIRIQEILRRATDDPSTMDRELWVTAAPTVIVHGATDKLALFGIFPYLDKKLRATTATGRTTRGDSGLGDVTLLARYTAAQWDSPGETRRIAPFAGVEAPTGRDDRKDSLGRLPQPLQLGSGSWDPVVGTVFTWQTLDWKVDTSISHKINTRANGFEFGDETRLDVSYQHRLLPSDLAEASKQEGVPDFLFGVLETNLIWQQKDKTAGGKNPDSGGFRMYVAPGVQYISRRSIVEAAVQLPVVQDLGGTALRDDFIVTLSFRISF